jgi:hypothetical protein
MCLDAASYFDPKDAASLASAALRLVGDPALMDERRRRGLAIMAARRKSNPYDGMVVRLAELGGSRQSRHGHGQ